MRGGCWENCWLLSGWLTSSGDRMIGRLGGGIAGREHGAACLSKVAVFANASKSSDRDQVRSGAGGWTYMWADMNAEIGRTVCFE